MKVEKKDTEQDHSLRGLKQGNGSVITGGVREPKEGGKRRIGRHSGSKK